MALQQFVITHFFAIVKLGILILLIVRGDFTDILLRDLKETFKDINFIGMRIMAGRDAGSFIRRYCGYYGDEFERNMNSWEEVKNLYNYHLWIS